MGVRSARELYDNFDLSAVCALQDNSVESQFVERKATKEVDAISKTLCAFANAPHDGILVLGIAPNGMIEGVDKLGESGITQILSAVGRIDTHVDYRFEAVMNDLGRPDHVILMHVYPVRDRVVFRLDKKAFIRRGFESVELHPQEIFQLMDRRRGQPVEDRLIALFNENDLDGEAVAWLLDKADQELNTNQSLLELLENLHLVAQNTTGPSLTVSGYLLLVKDPRKLVPGSYVRLIKYDGIEERFGRQQNIVKDETFWGPLPKVLLRLRDYLPSQFRDFTYLTGGGSFETRSEYPADAWDEAIVNALIHRSYGDGYREEPIFVKIFDNRLEVLSPGPFLEGIGPGRFRHKPRNPHLMSAMRLFRRVQMIGEGTRRMYQELAAYGLPPPDFSEPGDAAVLVTFRNDIEHRKAVSASEKEPTEVSNLFEISITAPPQGIVPFPDEFQEALSSRELRVSLVQRLREEGWAVDSFTEDTAINFADEIQIPALRESRLAAIYPGFEFRVLTFGQRRFLAIDHTVEVRCRASLDQVLKQCPYLRRQWRGRGFVREAAGKWTPARVTAIGDDSVSVDVREADQTRQLVVRADSIIPNLTTSQLADFLKASGIGVDLFIEVRRASLLGGSDAARERLSRTITIASKLATKVFPLKIKSYSVGLSGTPAKLTEVGFQVGRDLHETIPIFYRDRPEAKVIEGLTKHGAFDRPAQARQLPVCVLCPAETWPSLESLIRQIQQGSAKYQGLERTFGMRLSVPTTLLAPPSEYRRKLDATLSMIPKGTFFIVFAPEKGFSRSDFSSPYYSVKEVLLRSGFASQMVDEETLADPKFKDLNLALDIFAKAGFAPWVLSEGLPDADLFVGLAYSSVMMPDGMQRLLAYANVFDQFGRWRYYAGDSQVLSYEERNNLLRSVLLKAIRRYEASQKLRHVHLHLGFRLSHTERQEIARGIWDAAPEAQVSFIYINQHGLVRAYDTSLGGDGTLARGTYVKTGSNHFWLATTGANAFGDRVVGTPRILEVAVNRLKSHYPLDLRTYAQQLLSLTRLNWASSRNYSHEPITLKFASDIAHLMNVFVHISPDFKVHPDLLETPWFL